MLTDDEIDAMSRYYGDCNQERFDALIAQAREANALRAENEALIRIGKDSDDAVKRAGISCSVTFEGIDWITSQRNALRAEVEGLRSSADAKDLALQWADGDLARLRAQLAEAREQLAAQAPVIGNAVAWRLEHPYDSRPSMTLLERSIDHYIATHPVTFGGEVKP